MTIARVFGKLSPEQIMREAERLAALESLDMLDTPQDEGFERFVRLIQEIFTVEIGLISFMDAHRQWYKSCAGFSISEVPREETFCQYVVASEEPMIVQDATKDPIFSQHPAVTGDAHVRFYAGVPLKTAEGHVVGTVCAIDRRARSFSARDLKILEELSGAVMDRLLLMQSAATDGLTGAMTRRAFRDEADRQLSIAARNAQGLSCIVLDVDHFKRVNDTSGHAAGDVVLKAVAEICRKNLRTEDLFGRLGGEEFALILPKIDREAAIAIAERLRAALEAETIIIEDKPLKVTASFGISAISIVGKDIETLLAQADAAMYHAKNGGRNRCVCWTSVQSENTAGTRRRVLKAGSIIFNNRCSTIDCTIKSLGADSAALVLSNSAGVPPEFVLAIKGEGFETTCKVIAQDRQNLEVVFK
ncbi:sensor domain-containing diguanylate cyclase [Rhizobium sp. XQZ8]|uniref:sensor domain-containing diguanylate cyclase n=1 Tax=Rhizobium populisoli TaxID=2859785 RepID=UPI001C67C5E9|nr:sensor domain-containing diguanylate cyclase [Rhizobium populisoli]MBW6422219.1 sensor domain-containing diguanylate cyclase [Rhizobium populisoli]